MKKHKQKILIITSIVSSLVIGASIMASKVDLSILKTNATIVNNNPCYLKEGYQELDYYLSQNLPTSSIDKIDIKTRATVTRVFSDGNNQYAFLQRTNEQTRNKSSVYAYRLPNSPTLSFNDVIDVEASIYNYKNLPEITTDYTHFTKLSEQNPNEPIARELTKNNYQQLSLDNMSEFVFANNLYVSSIGQNVTSNSSSIIVNTRMDNVDVTLIINTMKIENTNAIANKIRSIVGNTAKAINVTGNYFTKTISNVEYRGICISNIDDVTIVDYQYSDEVGYYKQEELSIIASDLSYPNARGDLKTLVIPIELSDCSEWSDTEIENINNLFFDDTANIINNTIYSYPSFKEYYETASFNKINFSGLVTAPYETTHTSSELLLSSNDFYYLLADAIVWAQDKYSELNDHASWDTNNDGYVDNVHFISNYTTQSGDWGAILWPHMAQAGFAPHETYMSLNTYTMNAKNHLDNAYTTIHEQGHVFGLDDYYDYTANSRKDYVGLADMQSGNFFDWNSFSKLVVGWVEPYVINGELEETTITLGAAAETGDCLIIPADNATWNGSAFDEYFLIELFNPNLGNNLYQKSAYNNYIYSTGESLDQAGARVYHVDARLWERSHASGGNKEVPDADTLNNGITDPMNVFVGVNNSYDATQYASYSPEQWRDFKLLSLIQSGGIDTFGAPTRNFVINNDLFYTGDTFTFDEYKHFLSKTGQTVTTMDNGETFPYEIYFEDVSSDSITLKITKVN